MAFAMVTAAQVGARLSVRMQPRFLTAIGMFTAAFTLFFLFSGIDIKWGSWDIIWRLMLLSGGLGLGLSPLTNAATSTVPLHEVGIASSILALARNISGAFGIAIFATILSNSTTSQLLNLQTHSIINTINPALLAQIPVLMITKANVLAYSIVFKSAGAIMLVGAVSALLVRESKRDFATAEDLKNSPIEF
jgi:hypothetical protein